jgi:hypothetical protein
MVDWEMCSRPGLETLQTHQQPSQPKYMESVVLAIGATAVLPQAGQSEVSGRVA